MIASKGSPAGTLGKRPDSSGEALLERGERLRRLGADVA
jgi:hypothetical protein